MSSTIDKDIPQLNVIYLLTYKSCRICLRNDGHVSVYTKFEAKTKKSKTVLLSIREALKFVFPLLQLTEPRTAPYRYPSVVCTDCFVKVKGSYQLKLDYEFSTNTLTRLICNVKETEDIESSELRSLSINMETETADSVSDEYESSKDELDVPTERPTIKTNNILDRKKNENIKQSKITNPTKVVPIVSVSDTPAQQPEIKKGKYTEVVQKIEKFELFDREDEEDVTSTLKLSYPDTRQSDTSVNLPNIKTTNQQRDWILKDPIICVLCGKSFNRLCNYRSHKESHLERTIKCDYCDLMFKTNGYKKKHMRNIHQPKTPLTCNICNGNFSCQMTLQRHIDAVHLKIKDHKCLVCDKSFASKTSMQTHMIMHTGERKYKCHQCNKAYSILPSLKFHIKTKHDENYKNYKNDKKNKIRDRQCYKCEFCTETFYHFNHYVSHYKEYHPNEIIKIPHFKCDECDILFRQKKFYQNHMKIHTDGIKYECKICTKQFRTQYHLRLHLINHKKHKNSNLNPNQCQYCNIQFPKQTLFMEHMRSDHPEKLPYSCDICDKRFAIPRKLRRHKEIHAGINLYKCRYCNKGFSVRGCCRAHEKIHKSKGEQITEISLPVIIETQIESEAQEYEIDEIIEYDPIHDNLNVQ